jgi:hypothetical protein
VPRRRAPQFCGDGTSLDLFAGSPVQADPLANVCRAISQLNSAFFREPQEAYGGLIDELDFTQVQHDRPLLVCDLSLEIVQVLRLDAADESHHDVFVVGFLDDSQNHFGHVLQQKCRPRCTDEMTILDRSDDDFSTIVEFSTALLSRHVRNGFYESEIMADAAGVEAAAAFPRRDEEVRCGRGAAG